MLKDKIYGCGGSDQGDGVARYDPVASRWEDLAKLKTARWHHQVISYSDKIWVLGGQSISGTTLSDVPIEIYDLVSNTWNTSQIIKEACQTSMNVNSCKIVDCVVF